MEDKPVNVYIHKVNTSKTNGDRKIEVLYHVSVDGKPVSAITAANDMTLVSDEEVRRELGYPFLIKAERKYPGFLSKVLGWFLRRNHHDFLF